MSELSLATARPLFVDCHEGINHICFSPDGARQAISDVRMRVQVFEGDQAIFDHNFTSLSDRVRPTERVRGLGFCPASETLFVIAGEAISAIDTREGAVLWDYVPPARSAFRSFLPVPWRRRAKASWRSRLTMARLASGMPAGTFGRSGATTTLRAI